MGYLLLLLLLLLPLVVRSSCSSSSSSTAITALKARRIIMQYELLQGGRHAGEDGLHFSLACLPLSESDLCASTEYVRDTEYGVPY